jgi:CcmD family protein
MKICGAILQIAYRTGSSIYRGGRMFSSLLPVAIIVIVLWVGLFAYYIYVARQQTALREELESLQELLDKESPTE